MPTPLEDNSIVQLIINGEVYGQQCLNVLHYKMPGGMADYTTALDNLITNMDDTGKLLEKLCATLSTEYSIRSVDAQVVYPQRLARFRNAVVTNNQGIVEDAAVPSNVAAVITKRTDFAGRDQVGAFHVAGMPLEAVDEDEWIDDYKTKLNALGDQLKATYDYGAFGDFAKPVLWDPGSPTVTADITQTFTQPVIRVMRRRTKGVGR